MKVLFIQKEGGIFGAEQFHLRMIPALMKTGVELHFLRLYTNHQLGIDSPFVFRLRELGVTVHQVRIGKYPLPKDIFKVKRIIKDNQFDIVHTHLIHGDLYGALVKKLFLPKMKLVSTKHGYEESFNNTHGFDPAKAKENLYLKICRFGEKHVNRSFAISDALKDFFVGAGISNPAKMERIHYGFKMKPPFSAEPAGARQDGPKLIIVGRLVGFKGHRYALEALKILSRDYPGIHLDVVGIGELEDELRQKATDLEISDRVHFLGFRENIGELMNNADVVMIPSIAEGFGVVFLEAINELRPVGAFDVPAGNEIFADEYKEYLATPFEVDSLAANVKRLLEEKEQLKPILEKNKARLNGYFTIDRMISQIVDFYQRVLQE